jgi:hypothetical protein
MKDCATEAKRPPIKTRAIVCAIATKASRLGDRIPATNWFPMETIPDETRFNSSFDRRAISSAARSSSVIRRSTITGGALGNSGGTTGGGVTAAGAGLSGIGTPAGGTDGTGATGAGWLAGTTGGWPDIAPSTMLIVKSADITHQCKRRCS